MAARPAPEADAESSSVATTRETPNSRDSGAITRIQASARPGGTASIGASSEGAPGSAQLADERHLRRRREHTGAIDRGDARAQQRAHGFERHLGGRTQERDVATAERREVCLHGEDAAAELQLGAERALRGDRNQLAHGERGLIEHREQLHTQRAGRADDRDAH